VLGFVGGIALRLDWAFLLRDPRQFFDDRFGFGFGAISFGLFSGTVLLGLVLLRRRCWLDGRGQARRLRVLPWAIATAVAFQGLVMSRSRGAWLATMLGFAVGLWLSRAGSHGNGSRRPDPRDAALPPTAVDRAMPRRSVARRVGLGLAAIGLGALLLANAGGVVERLAAELETLKGMAAGEIAYEQDSSLSARWHAQVFGLEAWAERPLLGWGAGTTPALLAADPRPALIDEHGDLMQHLHNSYLEAAVQLGAIGMLLFIGIQLGLIALLWHRLREGKRGGTAPVTTDRDLIAFLIAALALLMAWQLFEFRAVHQDWRGFWTLLAGLGLGVGLHSAGGRR
jgi:O-antigen ligase